MRYFTEAFFMGTIDDLEGMPGVVITSSGKTFIYCDICWKEENRGVKEGVITLPEKIREILDKQNKEIEGFRVLIKSKPSKETIIVSQDGELVPPFFKGEVIYRYAIPYGIVINFYRNNDGQTVKIRRFGFQFFPQVGVVKLIRTVVFNGFLPFDKGTEAVRDSLKFDSLGDLTLLLVEGYRQEIERRKKVGDSRKIAENPDTENLQSDLAPKRKRLFSLFRA